MKRWGQFLARRARVWWVWPLVWLLLTGVAVKALPNLTQVVSNQSQSLLPASAEPTVAQHYLSRIGSQGAASGQEVLVVLHSAHRLTAHDRSLFSARLSTLHAKRQVGPAPAEGSSPFLSKSGTTDFAVVTLPAHAALMPTVHRITRALGNLGPGLKTVVTGSSVTSSARDRRPAREFNWCSASAPGYRPCP